MDLCVKDICRYSYGQGRYTLSLFIEDLSSGANGTKGKTVCDIVHSTKLDKTVQILFTLRFQVCFSIPWVQI